MNNKSVDMQMLKFIKFKLFRFVLLIVVVLSFAFICDRYIYPLPIEKLVKEQAYFVYDRNGQLLNSFASSDYFWRKLVTLEDLSPNLISSVLSIEDKYFYYHPGFNLFSFVNAAIDNYKAGRVVRGGSTITMQIARMIEPKQRSYFNKLIEIARAMQLEWHFTKDELLVLYFNLAPYGGNIEGVGAATHFYFDKEPDDLTLSEAAILTAIPSSPNKYRPDLHPKECQERRNKILSILLKNNIVSDVEYQHALVEEIPVVRMSRPFVAPHFSQSLLQKHSGESELHSTIDLNIQVVVNRLAEMHAASLEKLGIHNLSVVVIDNQSRELLVLVGSADYDDVEHNGQVNGALAFRSPGSTLKPFIYALGFEDGFVSPATKVDDIPISYSGYAPENYDSEYHGIISIDEALIESRNIPAVNLTAQVGLKRFYNLLVDGGISSLNKKYYEYGLPLVLGACELNLLELSNLFVTLANYGEYAPVRQLLDQDTSVTKKVLSDEASYLVSDILSNLQRPELTTSWEFTRDLPTIAWKTGTSYGRRDAWTIGYNPSYTVGVWAGNFSGEGSPDLVGVETAAPLMLNIFRELSRDKEVKWFKMPAEIGVREVCTMSGMLKNKYCQTGRQDLYISQKSPNKLCTVHRQIIVDKSSGSLLCRACAYGKDIDTLIIEQWEPRVSSWMMKQQLITKLPEHNKYCNGLIDDDAPIIVSPENGSIFEMIAGVPKEYQKILFQASSTLKSKTVHWFLNNELYQKSNGDEQVFFFPEKGKHQLVCVDDFGHSSKIMFEVK